MLSPCVTIPEAAGTPPGPPIFSAGQAVSPREGDKVHTRTSAHTHTHGKHLFSIFQDRLLIFFLFAKKMQAKEKSKKKKTKTQGFSIEGTSLLQYEDINWIESDPPCSGQPSPLVVAGAAAGWDGRELRGHLGTLPPVQEQRGERGEQEGPGRRKEKEGGFSSRDAPLCDSPFPNSPFLLLSCDHCSCGGIGVWSLGFGFASPTHIVLSSLFFVFFFLNI